MEDNTIVLHFNVQSYAQNFKMLCLGFACAHGGVIDGHQFMNLVRTVNSNDWHILPGIWVNLITFNEDTVGWITESQLSKMTPVNVGEYGSKTWEMKLDFSKQLTINIDGLSTDNDSNIINHPNHYVSGRFEVIDIIEEFCSSLQGRAAFDNGNAIKYILRWQRKNGIEDLKKAMWYIQDLIKQVESEETNNETSTDD